MQFAKILLACFYLVIALFAFALPRPTPSPANDETPAANDKVETAYYPDFGFLPARKQYVGRVFRLSQKYPKDLPPAATIPEICTRSFQDIKQDWKKYLLDVRAYCFEENVGHADVADDWRLENNATRRWYHMPWQHYGDKGREGIHGMTKEAPVQPRQLAWRQTHSGGQTYAVGFYNEFGGHTLYDVWHDKEHPGQKWDADTKKWKAIDISFPVGTVVCKVLFVDLHCDDKVPSLNPPLHWQGYVTKGYDSNEREIRSLSLIQMDIMVRHKDAPCGWLFGTFQYNGSRPGAPAGKPSWENLVPVGLQWGNDPKIRDDFSNPQPTKTIVNKKLQETRINEDTKELPPTHLGWNGRLNGPVDNAMSSCMSCHMTAAAPQKIAMSPLFEKSVPEPGSDDWMIWFQNIKCGEKFQCKGRPTDFSLQLAMALQNFYTWHDQGSKLRADNYQSTKQPSTQVSPPKMTIRERLAKDPNDLKDVPIERGIPRP